MKLKRFALLIAVACLLAGCASTPPTTDGLFEKAKAQIVKDQESKAIKTLEKLLAMDPDYPGAHHRMGHAYELLREYGEAIREYEQEIAMHNDAWSELALGLVYTHLLAFDQAEARIQNALDAGLPYGQYVLAQLRYAQFRTQDALDIVRDLDLPDLQTKQSHNERGLVLYWPSDQFVKRVMLAKRAEELAGRGYQPVLEIPDLDPDRVGSIIDDVAEEPWKRIGRWDTEFLYTTSLIEVEDEHCELEECIVEFGLVCETNGGASISKVASSVRFISEGKPPAWCFHEDCDPISIPGDQ